MQIQPAMNAVEGFQRLIGLATAENDLNHFRRDSKDGMI